MSQTGEQLALVAASGSELSRWLLEENVLSVSELGDAVRRQQETGAPLGMTLLELELVDELALVNLVARRNALPTAPERLYRQKVPVKALSAVPQDLCWQYGVFPFGVDLESSRLKVAVVDPSDSEAMDMLEGLTGGAFELFVAGPRALEKAIRKHYLDSWVEDSHPQEVEKKGLRFFGYEGITNPTDALSLRVPESATPAKPARPPQPSIRPQRGDEPVESKSASDVVARVTLQNKPVVAPEPAAALPTPPEQDALQPADLLEARVQRLEQAVQLMLQLVMAYGSDDLRDDAARVVKLIDG
ncbi:MAG: hypothetical protein CSB49_01680 [Proteobacteria bacterium]|nr:MAG: hypothetical protein CSB49_01680 [Pseudomonadota bacterium]